MVTPLICVMYGNIWKVPNRRKRNPERSIARSDGNYHVVTNGKAGNDVYCEYNGVTADKNI